MAGSPFVFTIARGAEMLAEDEDWLQELAIDMLPEDGCLWVLDIGEREVTPVTEYAIKCLKQIIADKRIAAQAPAPKAKP